MGEATEQTGRGRRAPLLSGQAGKVRSALSAAVQQARAGDRLTVEHEVRALLAERYAAAVDRASSQGDAAGLLRAGDKLLELLDTLPLVVDDEMPKGGAGDDRSSDRGKLLELVHGDPTVGDTADA